MDALIQKSLEDFRVNACDAVTFKLIRNKDDFDAGEEFGPEYTHQIFGESEQIFGFKNLKINLWYLAGSLKTYIGVSYTNSINKKLSKGVSPDDIMSSLSEVFDYKFDTSLVDFSQTFHNDTFKPYGSLRHTYTMRGDSSRKFSIYYIEHGMPDFEEFVSFHKRMESFLLFFVDGASAISTDDKQWCFYTIFEVLNSEDAAEPKYAFIGYMTVYKFYAYPANLRPRVSQVLVLPPFRNAGHASEFLRTLYRDFVHVPAVRDITVEDSSIEFQRIRDFLDCKRCLAVNQITNILTEKGIPTANGVTNTSIRTQYKTFRDLLQQKLKISRYQAKRLHDILCLYLLPRNPEALKSFKSFLHQRTLGYYRRTRTDTMRGQSLDHRANSSSTVASSSTNGSNGETIRKVFDEVEKEQFGSQVEEHVECLFAAYQEVVAKLDRYKTPWSDAD